MLEVAVQMDPLEKINFAGDSTFALMLGVNPHSIPAPAVPPSR